MSVSEGCSGRATECSSGVWGRDGRGVAARRLCGRRLPGSGVRGTGPFTRHDPARWVAPGRGRKGRRRATRGIWSQHKTRFRERYMLGPGQPLEMVIDRYGKGPSLPCTGLLQALVTLAAWASCPYEQSRGVATVNRRSMRHEAGRMGRIRRPQVSVYRPAPPRAGYRRLSTVGPCYGTDS